MYPVKKPMMIPFLIPQRCAEVRFLSYLGDEGVVDQPICANTGLVQSWKFYWKILPLYFFLLPTKSSHCPDG